MEKKKIVDILCVRHFVCRHFVCSTFCPTTEFLTAKYYWLLSSLTVTSTYYVIKCDLDKQRACIVALLFNLLRSLVIHRPEAGKVLSASTYVGGTDFRAS